VSWAALLLCVAAFGAFGYATDEHHHRLTGRRLDPRGKRRWRSAAWGALAAALAAAVAARGWAFGPVLWSGTAMFAAGLVFLALNLGPRRTRSAPDGRKTP
jgi:hypothetical protein